MQEYEKVVDLQGYWKFTIGDDMSWAEADYDDSEWTDIVVPAPWENEGFHGYDGFAWYRVNFSIELDKTEAYYLELGYIDDADEVYINGQLVGFSGSFAPNFYTAYNSFRRYYIPTEILNDGINTIAVRVYDTVLDGGIIKGSPGVYVKKNKPKTAYMIEGIWKFQAGTNDDWRDPEYDDSDWDHTTVPGFWKSMKSYRMRNFATYRMEFTLPEHLRDEQELVIVLGKIDDFDKVYLNGKLIGYTKDDQPLGQSQSWQEYRIYGLFNSSLNRNGKNTLVVEVEDMGINAGIYEGPLAITTTADFKKLIKSYN
jgi:sialate O-acetylesterase